MSRHRWRLAASIAVSAALFLWPFLSPESAMNWLAHKLSTGAFLTLWGASALAGVWIALNAVLSHLRGGGRAAIAGQPALGLAGKRWGVLAPGAWMLPVLLLFIVAFAMGWQAGIGGPLVMPALLVCLILLGYYARILRSIDRRRRALQRRSDASLLQETQTGNFTEAEFQSAIMPRDAFAGAIDLGSKSAPSLPLTRPSIAWVAD
jgi:hypothetical protein